MPDDLRTTFEQLLGRQPSDREIQGLYRVKTALGIRDNDALWHVLMALQSYDSLYRMYPAMIADEVRKIVDEQRGLIRASAEAEVTRSQGILAEAVSRAGMQLANNVAEASRYQSWGWLLIGLMGFGSMCMLAGAILSTGRLPGWSPSSADHTSLLAVILASIARTPAGWIAAFGGGFAGLASAWRARGDIRRGKRLGLVVSSTCLVLASCALLVFAL